MDRDLDPSSAALFKELMFGKLSSRQWLWILVGFGFVLRLAFALKSGINAPPTSDAIEFDSYAWNLAQGHGYRGISADVTDPNHLTAYRPPVPSMVWAALYFIFGHHVGIVRVAHCLIGAATILLVYEIGRRCYSDSVGLLAAALFTIYPYSLLIATVLEAESISLALFLSYIVVSLQFAEKPTWLRATGAGLLLGLTLLARAWAVFMLPLAGCWALWQFRGRWREMLQALLIPTAAVLTLVPWTIRNYMVFHAFIPFSTMGGSALLQANNRVVVTDPLYFGYTVWDTKIPEYRDALRAPNDELERDRVANRLAVEWLKANPDKWWFLAREKLTRAFSPFLKAHVPAFYRWSMLLSWGPVLVLFALAFFPTLIGHLRNRQPAWLLHLAIVHFVLNTIPFHGLARYRYSIEPFCLILACVSALWLWDRFRSRTSNDRLHPQNAHGHI